MHRLQQSIQNLIGYLILNRFEVGGEHKQTAVRISEHSEFLQSGWVKMSPDVLGNAKYGK